MTGIMNISIYRTLMLFTCILSPSQCCSEGRRKDVECPRIDNSLLYQISIGLTELEPVSLDAVTTGGTSTIIGGTTVITNTDNAEAISSTLITPNPPATPTSFIITGGTRFIPLSGVGFTAVTTGGTFTSTGGTTVINGGTPIVGAVITNTGGTITMTGKFISVTETNGTINSWTTFS